MSISTEFTELTPGPIESVQERFVDLQSLLNLRHPNNPEQRLLSWPLFVWFSLAGDGIRPDNSASPSVIDTPSLFACLLLPGFVSAVGRVSEEFKLSNTAEPLSSLADSFNAWQFDHSLQPSKIAIEPQFNPLADALIAPEVLSALVNPEREALPSSSPISLGGFVVELLHSNAGRNALEQLIPQNETQNPWGSFIESIAQWHIEFFAVLEKGAEPFTWDEHLMELSSLPFPPQGRPAAFPRYAADTTGGLVDEEGKLSDSDPLGAIEDARAIAKLICHRDATPPLSIGLFAPWGGGKSTFIRVLQAAIDETTASQVESAESLLVERVVHIHFNAWHYVDANLWASLATRIFGELKRQATQNNAPNWLDESGLNDLSENLATVKEARAAQKKQQEQLTKEREALEQQISQLAESRQQAASEAEQQRRADLLKLIKVKTTDELRAALDKLGLTPSSSDDAKQIMTLWQETRGLGGELRTLLQTLLAQPLPTLMLALAALTVFSITAIGIPSLFIQLGWFAEHGSLDSLVTNIGSITGALAGLAVWLLPMLKRVRSVIAPLARTGRDLETQLEKEQQLAEQQIATAEQQVSRLQAEEALLSQRIAALGIEEQRLSAMDAGEDPVGLMTAFIDDRARSDRYSKHLGLVSLLREDFEVMVKLLTSSQQSASSSLKIDRIVLYIDDLDRVPDKQVIAVLEAVHLLLAFKLFVVVVGVDIRWVSGALRRVYDQQFGKEGFVRPSDYLSKIFQIPFWLPQLRRERDRYQKLVASLLSGQTLDSTPRPNLDDRDFIAQSLHGTDLVNELQPVDAPADFTPAESRRITEVSLQLDPREIWLINELYQVAGDSPRALKRFINVYRIHRARQPQMQMDNWLGERVLNDEYDDEDDSRFETPRYPAHLLVLAIECGLDPDLAAFVEALVIENQCSIHMLMEILRRIRTLGRGATASDIAPSQAENPADAETNEEANPNPDFYEYNDAELREDLKNWLSIRFAGSEQIKFSESFRKSAANLATTLFELDYLQHTEEAEKPHCPIPQDYDWINEMREVYRFGDVQRYTFRLR